MIRNPSEKSLIEILQGRPDTCFDGWQVDEETAQHRRDTLNKTVYQDEQGNYYRVSNDYLQTREVDGRPVAIFVADEDDKHVGVPHPHTDLPHLIGLYVREDYRSEGIATELVHEFMETVESDTCVVDCTERVKPFYEQLDCDVIYLQQFKR